MSATSRDWILARKRYPNWLDYAGYTAMHVACLGVLWTGVSIRALLVCAVMYASRMFGLMAGYHRYFSHRSFKTSRVVQFGLALLGTLGVQKGVLWWASHHRHHHRYSDTPLDVHSPLQRSFLYSHSGWFLDIENRSPDYSKVSDFLRYPELVWLDRYDLIPVVALALGIFLGFGWQGLFWGFFVSTVLIWHGIHAIGSFGHRSGGYRRFATADNSRNKWLIALLLLGEGWHNNHHFYPSSARQGFVWWEVDVAYYVLRIMGWLGLVWDLKVPPRDVCKVAPRSQAQVRRFERWVMDLRHERSRAVEQFAARGGFEGPSPEADAALLKQELELHVDAFHAQSVEYLVSAPERLVAALGTLAAGSEQAMVHVGLPSTARAELRSQLAQATHSHVRSSPFASFMVGNQAGAPGSGESRVGAPAAHHTTDSQRST